ncbi:MAG TPA: CheR family methyltransferase, partial [Chthoniobacterales bacterium]|nr:CheR family methyltransferase [Chthoniobacterales bacterium]
FGTDLSESAIDRARLGIYSSSIEKDVSPKRLQRFFKKRDGTYQITRIVRDLCTFARQNITTDPPFSRLDLISCRNVLIYLGPQLQRRVLPIFHYALNSNGYLILGPSETVGVFGDMFELVDRRAKIYAKKVLRTPREIEYRSYTGFSEIKSLETPRLAPIAEGADFNSQVMKMADRIMLGTYAPAAVVVDESMQIRQFRGETTPYLEHVTGPATLNLLHMVRPSLVPDLRLTFQRALKLQKPARKERVMMKRNASLVSVDVEVVPFKIAHTDTNWAMVIFKETAVVQEPKRTGARKGRGKSNDKRESEIEHLRQELGATRESLQAIIEEQEATNEELKSANEEIESSNEELQSTNEELETAKEELQSTNEELTTLNEELSNRNLQILQINSDLINVLSSVHIPIVMVDNSLIVRRATPTARDAFNITEADTGRRMIEIRPNIVIPNLEKLLREVIETLHLREREVQDKQGNRYLLQVRPYRTADNKIDGAVLMLVDRQERGRSHVGQGSRKAGKKR